MSKKDPGNKWRAEVNEYVTLKPSSKQGQERWHLSVGGHHVTVTTSGASSSVMDTAVQKYAKALKRLADK